MGMFTVPTDSTPDTPSFGSIPSATPGDVVSGTRMAMGTDYGMGSHIVAAVGGAIPDLADTISSSLGFTDRGQINEGLLNAIGSPGLRDFYEGNRGSIEVGGAVASVIAADFAATRFLRPTGAAMGFMSKLPFVGRIASLDRQYNVALRIAQTSDLNMARAGAMGMEQYVGDTTVARLGAPAIQTTQAGARSMFIRSAVVKGLARNTLTEGILAVGAHTNSFLYGNDTAENIMFMAGGLGLGGLIDRMMAVHTLKQFANSDIMNRAFAGAFDPHGTESARIGALHTSMGMAEDVGGYGFTNGMFTDQATSLKLSADEGRNAEVLAGGTKNPLFGRRNRLATQQDEVVRSTLNKATARGIPGVQGSAFGMNADGFGNHIDYLMHRDPAGMYGVEEAGAPGPGMTTAGIHADRMTQIQGRIVQLQDMMKDGGTWETRTRTDPVTREKVKAKVLRPFTEDQAAAISQEHDRLQWRDSFTPMVAIDGEWTPRSFGEMFDNYVEPDILHETSADLHVWQARDRVAGSQVGVDSDLNVHLPAKKKLGQLGLQDTMSLYRSAQQANRWFESTGNKMILPKKPTWFQLDMAEDLIRRTGNEDQVIFPGGMGRTDAQVESFRQKAQAISTSKPLMTSDSTQAHLARLQFNLPRLSSFEAGLMGTEQHPIEIMLRGAQDMDLKDVNFHDLVDGLATARRITGMTELAKDRGDQLSGNMFNFMVDDSGKAMAPILAYKRPFQAFEWMKDNLAERLAMGKHYMRTTMIDPKNAGPMTRDLTQNILGSPDFIAASQVTGLQDSQLQSMLPGFQTAAPQSVRGGLLQDVIYHEMRDRDTPALLAATRIRDMAARRSGSIMQTAIESNMGDVITRMNGPRNTASKLLLNQFLSYRGGWDLLTKKVAGKDVVQVVTDAAKDGRSMHNVLLDPNSIGNQQRFKQAFGRDLQNGDTLLSPQGQKVGLDDLAHEWIQKFSGLSDSLNVEKNTLNRAMGLGEINTIPYYAPPPNIKGKYMGFTLDLDGNPVPNGTVIAATQEDFVKQRARLEDPANDASPLNKPGNRFMSQDEITDFNTVWDKAQMNMIDPGTTAIQPNKRGKGNLLGQDINMQAAEDALVWARDSYLKHGQDVVNNLFKDQITAAQTRAQIAGPLKRNALTGRSEAKTPSIYDIYLQNLLGKVDRGSSVLTTWRQPVEDWINSALRGGKPVVSRTFKGAMDWVAEHKPWDTSAKSTEAFNTLVDSLGEYMPFKNAAELAERQYGAKRPVELGVITGDLSRFEATMRLRMFEPIMALMNLSGMINAMPAVIRAMQPRAGEAAADFATRVGHSAQIFNLAEGKSIGIFDMPKMIYQTFKNTWNRTSHADWDYMAGHGYVTQEVAEFQRQWNAVNSRDGWKAFMFGNPNLEGVSKKGLVNHVSVLTDKSEDFSRSWGHMAGLTLAKDVLGITDREAQHAFAHDVANKMIANYDPKNRPAIFQGALGAPVGLFQSFIWNYYQRLFRYMETGDARAFATQYATQSALFGVTGVPGFNEVNKMFFDHSNGDNEPVDGIYQRWGQQGGDFLFGGILSNLPKLLNLLPGVEGVGGVDLSSRGDANIRLPGLNAPPIVDTFSRVKNLVTQGIQMFSSSNPNVTMSELAEIVSNTLTNRPMAGMVEQFLAHGTDTDNSGQVVGQTHDWLEGTARVLGTRSLRQTKELEAFYANRNAMEIQRSSMDQLNQSSRAAIRAGDSASLPGYFNQYVQNGGDPRRFNQWIRRNMEAATESRGERQLDQMGNNPRQYNLMQHLLDMGVSVPESGGDNEPQANPYNITPDIGAGGMQGPSIENINPDSTAPTYDNTLMNQGQPLLQPPTQQ